MLVLYLKEHEEHSLLRKTRSVLTMSAAASTETLPERSISDSKLISQGISFNIKNL